MSAFADVPDLQPHGVDDQIQPMAGANFEKVSPIKLPVKPLRSMSGPERSDLKTLHPLAADW
jgi:hypothetical protein